MNEEQIKELLLANFCDGDSWNDAKADRFTHEGALDIAKFYYNAGVEAERERIWKEAEKMKHTVTDWQGKDTNTYLLDMIELNQILGL